MYGGAGEYIYRRGKDPDNPDEGDLDPFGPIADIKKRLDDLYANLEELDTDHQILEVKFNDQLKEKTIEVEQLDPQEFEEKEIQLEFQELKRLERQLKKVELEKIRLLKKEYQSEKSLLYTSGKRAIDIEEQENLFELK